MTKPFFSIVIPALNEEKHLPNLLKDLNNQSYRDFEVIVVDGASEDKTVEESKKFKQDLPKLLFLSSARRHVCTQRNLGAKKAAGEYLIFMDADNRLPTYFLLGIKYHLELNPTHLLTTQIRPDINNRTNHAISNAINLFQEANFSTKPAYLLESMIIVNKSVFMHIGGFDESINLAEGKSFITNIVKNNYSYQIIKEPSYQYSLRRIRKYGALGIAGRIARHEINELIGIKNSDHFIKTIYPMKGGAFLDAPNKKSQKFRHKIKALISLLNTNLEPKSFPTLKKRLNKLLS